MLRVYKNLYQYESSKADLYTWIYAIVRNEALTIIRNKKTTTITNELIIEKVDAQPVSPLTTSVTQEIIALLNQLTETTRTICNLYYFEEYSIKEIACIFTMKEGTVKWHLSEGRKKLQTIMQANSEIKLKVV